MADGTRHSKSPDMLPSIFAMQAIADHVEDGHLSVNDLPNEWLGRYARAMEEELEELKRELHWKWWSKDQINLQNIRVELVDLLHFLVSAMLCAGLTPDRAYDLYCQKRAINVARQHSGYCRNTKTEDDNRTIQ